MHCTTNANIEVAAPYQLGSSIGSPNILLRKHTPGYKFVVTKSKFELVQTTKSLKLAPFREVGLHNTVVCLPVLCRAAIVVLAFARIVCKDARKLMQRPHRVVTCVESMVEVMADSCLEHAIKNRVIKADGIWNQGVKIDIACRKQNVTTYVDGGKDIRVEAELHAKEDEG